MNPIPLIFIAVALVLLVAPNLITNHLYHIILDIKSLFR